MRRRTTELVKAHDDDMTHRTELKQSPHKSGQSYDDRAWETWRKHTLRKSGRTGLGKTSFRPICRLCDVMSDCVMSGRSVSLYHR